MVVSGVVEVLARVAYLYLVIAPDVEDVLPVGVDVGVPTDPSEGVVDVVDVLRLGFADRRVSVIGVTRRVGRGQVVVDRPGGEGRGKTPEHVLIAVDVNTDFARDTATVGGISVLAPERVSVLRVVPTVGV